MGKETTKKEQNTCHRRKTTEKITGTHRPEKQNIEKTIRHTYKKTRQNRNTKKSSKI